MNIVPKAIELAKKLKSLGYPKKATWGMRQYSIILERFDNYFCMEMILNKPMRIVRIFEKNLLSYKSDSREIIEFEITDRYFQGKRVFRETNK